jgi:hypothetical protein
MDEITALRTALEALTAQRTSPWIEGAIQHLWAIETLVATDQEWQQRVTAQSPAEVPANAPA